MADSIRGKIKNVGAYPAAVEIFCFDGCGLFYAQGRARCIAAKAAPGPRGRVGADKLPPTRSQGRVRSIEACAHVIRIYASLRLALSALRFHRQSLHNMRPRADG